MLVLTQAPIVSGLLLSLWFSARRYQVRLIQFDFEHNYCLYCIIWAIVYVSKFQNLCMDFVWSVTILLSENLHLHTNFYAWHSVQSCVHVATFAW